MEPWWLYLLGAVAFLSMSTYCSAEGGKAQAIDVGSNIQVSVDHGSFPHAEMLIAADPNNKQRLIACSMHGTLQESPGWVTTTAYVSLDGGQHWKATLDVPSSSDPACEFGVDGSVYLICQMMSPPDISLHLYRSQDGGLSWAPALRLPTLDRESISIDSSAGDIYIVGRGSSRAVGQRQALQNMTVLRSIDGGSTFSVLSSQLFLRPTGTTPQGTIVVLSDGTLVWAFGQLSDASLKYPHEGQPNAKIWAFRSSDHGQSFDGGAEIGDFWYNHAITGQIGPLLAADKGSRYFKDRIYAVWADQREGHSCILSSFSSDNGLSWSEAQVINDDRRHMENTHPIDHVMPAVAVNRDGVVGISWYDRRDFPDESGWVTRFRASLDGGETWLPSRTVSEHPNAYSVDSTFPMFVETQRRASLGSSPGRIQVSIGAHEFMILGGDTAGLAADSDGIFHPLWIDNRTGVAQVWTAAVSVRGIGMKNGASELATLDDISEKVMLEFNLTQPSYDRHANTITVMTRMRNISKTELHGPIKARVVTFGSEIGVPRILNAENGANGTGAVWDFTSRLPGGVLAPGQVTKSLPLVFALADLRPFRQGEEHFYHEDIRFRWGLITVKLQVLGSSETQ